ncbi:MAG TPA: FKBP-type peptidyl-prolyl cis-trans isomerase [Verrucomicrobiae bacterium]|nr:FKBP-type peptidyl-prolyl cis-trans isomerase [Verrucomicrobiae bacterium]
MKNKYVWVVVVGIVIIGLGGGCFWWWPGHHKAQPLNDGAASINTDSTVAQTNSTNGGLSVAPTSGAQNLGQLSGSQKSSNNVTAQGTSSNSSSGSSGAVDPSTFSQYDKYKSGTSALFGDIQVGTGAELGANQQAAVYYKGWLTNGQLFDESRTGSDGKLQPFTFTLGAHQVIPGWEQGLSGMKVGGTRLVIVPPAVGYGSQAQGSIPANSVLVFEVQLVAVQ